MATWSLQAKLAGGALSALVVETILAALALTMFNQMNGMAVMPISDWQTALVIALWVTGGLCTLGFWFILHRDIVRPLRYITSHLELVALGDYSTPLLATNPDLIGEVTTRLDALRVEIAQIDAASQQTIERRVQILSGAIVVGQSLSSVQGTARVLQTGVEAVCSAFRQVHYARVYLPDNSTTEVLPGATAGQQTSEGRDRLVRFSSPGVAHSAVRPRKLKRPRQHSNRRVRWSERARAVCSPC